MTLGSAMRASAAGLSAERFRMNVISVNLSHVGATTSLDGKAPYRAQDVVLESTGEGVRIGGLVQSQKPLPMKYEPGHPFADAEGNVQASNVEPIHEMVNMMSASRAYEANIAAFNTAKGMVKSALNIGKV